MGYINKVFVGIRTNLPIEIKIDFDNKIVSPLGNNYWMLPEITTIEGFVNTFHPDSRGIMSDLLYQNKEFNTTIYKVFQVYDGKAYRHVLININKIIVENHEHGISVGTISDIDNFVNREDIRSNAQNRFQTIFENSPFGVVLMDRHGYIIEFNNAMLQILNIYDGDINSQKLYKYVHPEDVSDLHTTYEMLIKGKLDSSRLKQRFISEDKSESICEVTLASVMKDNGEIGSIMAFVVDITERTLIEGKLRHSEKMNAIGQLAGGISHDFNNQLMGIIGYTEILKSALENEKYIGYTNKILNAAHHSSELTKKLLAYSRKENYILNPVDIIEVIEDAIDILKPGLGELYTLKIQKKCNKCMTKGDKSSLENAILNIVINARDSMKIGGEIKIKVDNLYINNKSYLCSEDGLNPGYYIQISINDHGTGMSKNTINRIFEPFYTTKEEGAGSGLGLAAVYGTIHSHKGTVKVKSKLGIGTEFIIYIPCYNINEKENKEDTNNKKKIVTHNKRIMIIDDEEIVRDILTTILEKEGYIVVPIESGEEAIKYYKHNYKDINVVFIDMVMPKISGQQIFAELKKINSNIKAYILSGYTKDESLKPLIDEGILGFLQKPIHRDTLINTISSTMV